jgi:hypothetical protein
VRTRLLGGVGGGIREDSLESRWSMIPSPSPLDLDVPLSVHPAPDILGLRLAPVQVVMAALMNSH